MTLLVTEYDSLKQIPRLFWFLVSVDASVDLPFENLRFCSIIMPHITDYFALVFSCNNSYTAVVVYCHSRTSSMAKFLFRAQDQNMTNGDFAIFTFKLARSSSSDRPWNPYGSYADDLDDLPRRRRAFLAVKQVHDVYPLRWPVFTEQLR